jgi:dTMP kinase
MPRKTRIVDTPPAATTAKAETRRGKFITFEGGEGSGKSTQVARLAAKLKPSGLSVVASREPGGSAGAEAIRHVLLSGAAKPLGPHAEAILFAAARADHLRQTIRPALERGQWVISDRFADSTRVYQGVLGNVDARLIARLEKITVGELTPDLTIILDIAPEIGLKRAGERRGNAAVDRFEGEAFEFHKKLREAYLELAQREPQRCVVIDASADPATVAERVWSAVYERLHLDRAPPRRVRDAS